jgi:hypothetical protein
MYRFWKQRFSALAAGLGAALILENVFAVGVWTSLGVRTVIFVRALGFVGGISPDPNSLPLYPPGIPIAAIRRFGPIADGTPWVITGLKTYRHWGVRG